jgi:hypothetical protein
VQLDPEDGNARSSCADVQDEVVVWSERAEGVVLAGIKHEACGYARQESVPLFCSCGYLVVESVWRHVGELFFL